MKVSDYIVARLAHLGVDTCFSVTGGGAMHLNDSFGQHPSVTNVYNHHEQASAMAAEGYARISGKPAAVCVTTGPGAINALNGVFGAFTDSIPMIVVAGQVKRQTIAGLYPELHELRQLGDQEARSIDIVKKLTKFSCRLDGIESLADLVDRAYLNSVAGRPGPVWIEVPVDVQAAEVDLDPKLPLRKLIEEHPPTSSSAIEGVLDRLLAASRPVIFAGSGIRLSKTEKALVKLVETTNTPVVTAWTHDIFDNSHRLFAGRPGTIGTRPGNFVVQNADYVLVLGSRLNIRQVSYAWETFAHLASIDWVDIDPAEMKKPFPKVDQTIRADLREFLPRLAALAETREHANLTARSDWISWCSEVNLKYCPKETDYKTSSESINPYHFIFKLFENQKPQDIYVLGNASACIIPFQIGTLGEQNRMFSNSGSASMGYDLPAAIGASAATNDERVICLAGDGSIMMNIQELAILKSLNKNLAILILDNGGYLSIKQTQTNFFGREHGASEGSGVSFPDLAAVSKAFGLTTRTLSVDGDWETSLSEFLEQTGPRVAIVKLNQLQEFEPRLKSKMIDGIIQTPALDDMYPHLSNAELESVRQSAAKIV